MSTDREAGARVLRQLRESRGWSWADLARALRDTARQLVITSLTDRQVASIQRTVARWESVTERTSPSIRYQILLAHVYARTPTGDLVLGPGSDFGALLDALRHFGTPAQRLKELVELVDQSGLAAPSKIDHDTVSELERSVLLIKKEVGATPFVRLQLRVAPVVEFCRRHLRPGNPRQDELTLLATNAYALAARLAFETRDDENAMALYANATDVAEHLDDRSHRAAVRTSHAMVTLHATNDVDAACQIARAATVDAHQGASYAIRARAHAVHAEICARARQSEQAAEALDRAWKTVDQLTVEDPHGGFDSSRLNGFVGLCALHADNANRAHESLDHALGSLTKPRDVVQRGIVSTDLALARLRLGDPAACVDLLHTAVDITAATCSRVPSQRIRLVRRELRPWRAEYFLAELDDRIHDTLIGQ